MGTNAHLPIRSPKTKATVKLIAIIKNGDKRTTVFLLTCIVLGLMTLQNYIFYSIQSENRKVQMVAEQSRDSILEYALINSKKALNHWNQ